MRTDEQLPDRPPDAPTAGSLLHLGRTAAAPILGEGSAQEARDLVLAERPAEAKGGEPDQEEVVQADFLRKTAARAPGGEQFRCAQRAEGSGKGRVRAERQ